MNDKLSPSRSPLASSRHATVADWVRRVRQTPDLRLSRISAIRDALERNRYERESMVDHVVERVADELL
jgi:predicted metal-dependent RNase